MSSQAPNHTGISRTLSSEAVAAALKASPSLTIRTSNLDIKETQAPPPSPVDFDWSPAHSVDEEQYGAADTVTSEDWKCGREQMRVAA